LGAMETGYQRGRIQDESMHYEHMKHDGSQPIIGVNMFLAEGDASPASVELTRGTEEEKRGQICRLEAFQERHQAVASAALGQVQSAALNNENVFAQLMIATRYCSLGQITDALFEVGGRYRRNM